MNQRLLSAILPLCLLSMDQSLDEPRQQYEQHCSLLERRVVAKLLNATAESIQLTVQQSNGCE